MFSLAESMVDNVVKKNCPQAFCFNYNDMICGPRREETCLWGL